jgi:hypothetical protein
MCAANMCAYLIVLSKGYHWRQSIMIATRMAVATARHCVLHGEVHQR